MCFFMKCMKRSNPGMSREVCFSPELKRFCLIAAAPARLQPAESLFNIWNYQIGNNALIRFLPQRLNRNWVKQGNIGGASTRPNWKANEKHFNICNLWELGVQFLGNYFTFAFFGWLLLFECTHVTNYDCQYRMSRRCWKRCLLSEFG